VKYPRHVVEGTGLGDVSAAKQAGDRLPHRPAKQGVVVGNQQAIVSRIAQRCPFATGAVSIPKHDRNWILISDEIMLEENSMSLIPAERIDARNCHRLVL